MRLCTGAAIGFGLCAVVAAAGQQMAAPAVLGPGSQAATPDHPTGLLRGHLPVLNRPFSLTEVDTSEKVEEDGTKLTTSAEQHRMRDSAGRVRVESLRLTTDAFEVKRVQIFDPVANVTIVLNPQTRTAILTHESKPDATELFSARRLRDEAADQEEGLPGPDEQPLAPRTIAGDSTEGLRHVTTVRRSVGVGVGGGVGGGVQETQVEVDTWRSKALGIVLLRKTLDPVRGNTTQEVTQLSRGEPDPALFAIPPDYRIEEHEAVKTITPPRVIFKPDVEYSGKARRKKISGSVLMGLTVDERGMPANVHVERGLGYGLDEKALAAVKQYRFEPATQDGRSVPTQIKVEVNFQIY